MDRLAAMQVFVQVVETGGLSAAGRVLGLAPSSVSRRIGELEDILGARLLQRTTRRLSLTETGAAYYERCRDILQAVDEATLSVTDRQAAPAGVLRVSVPTSLARLHLVPAVAAFHALHPAVRVALSVSGRMVDIVGEGFDLAIRAGQLSDSSLIARKIGEARRLVCASPAYLRRTGEPERPAQLAGRDCLTFRSHAGSNLWRFRRNGRTTEVRVTGPFFADEGETLVAAAAEGLGIILVPEWLAGPDIAAGRLVEILADFAPDPARTPLYALHPPGPHMPPKVRFFVDFLAGRFTRDDVWRTPQAR